MLTLRDNNRLSACFQLAILSLTYIREIMLLLGLVSLSSPVYYASIGLMLLWNVQMLMSKGKKDWSHVFFYGFIAIVGVLLVLECRKHAGAVVAAVGRIIIVMYFLNLVRASGTGSRYLLRCNTFWTMVYTLALFVMSLSGYSCNDHGQLVFAYGNPNLTGLSAYICVLNLVIGLYVCRPNGERLLTCGGIVLALFVCLLSKSRASLMAIGVFLILAVVLCKVQGRKYAKALVLAGPLVMVLFPPLWILFYKLVGNPEWKVLGKVVFSYRELIWEYMYDVLLSSPFAIQLGQAVEHGSGPHNVPLAVWWDYGILAFGCFCAVWYLFIDRLHSRVRYTADCVILAAVISAAVSMTFEVLLFSGGLNFTFRLFYLAIFLNVIRDGRARMRNLFSLRSLKEEALLAGKWLWEYFQALLNRLEPKKT